MIKDDLSFVCFVFAPAASPLSSDTCDQILRMAMMRSYGQSSFRQRPRIRTFSSLRLLILLSITLYSCCVIAAQSASDYYVRSLPGQPEGPLLEMHAG